MSSTFGRIDARKRADQVRDRIADLLRSGDFREGDKIPTELQLMEMFGVGRSSVRAAVQSLVGLGIIEVRPGRGAYVRRQAVDEVSLLVERAVRLDYNAARHIHEVRAMIETTAARLAARRRNDDDLAAMRIEIERYRTAASDGDREASITADLGFHRAIVLAARNPVLRSLLDSITDVLREHRREYGSSELAISADKVDAEHTGILDAIERGDDRLASARVARHMRIIWAQIEDVTGGESADDPGVLFDPWSEDA